MEHMVELPFKAWLVDFELEGFQFEPLFLTKPCGNRVPLADRILSG